MKSFIKDAFGNKKPFYVGAGVAASSDAVAAEPKDLEMLSVAVNDNQDAGSYLDYMEAAAPIVRQGPSEIVDVEMNFDREPIVIDLGPELTQAFNEYYARQAAYKEFGSNIKDSFISVKEAAINMHASAMDAISSFGVNIANTVTSVQPTEMVAGAVAASIVVAGAAGLNKLRKPKFEPHVRPAIKKPIMDGDLSAHLRMFKERTQDNFQPAQRMKI